MCVGLKVEEPLLTGDQIPESSKFNTPKQKRKNNEERKEKAKDAARNRRTQESDYFEDLERLLPVSGPPPSSQQTSLDKTSIIRLSVAHLKVRDVMENCLQMPEYKEEVAPEIDLFDCLDGFSLALGSNEDIIYVTENVSSYIGLTQVELLGQDFSDYVHPCDHKQLRKLTPKKTIGSDDQFVEIFVRVKCTVTERGRMINLKQANYKPMKISGKCHTVPENKTGGIRGSVFLGVARSVVEREVILDQQIGVFATKHSVDMRFIETDPWMSLVASYSPRKLLGVSFFELVHAQDIVNVQSSFKNLKDHGQCETPPYRLLCYGGGFAWVQTKVCLAATRRGSTKGQTVSCTHQQISGVMNKDEILSIIQIKTEASNPPQTMRVANETQTTKTELFLDNGRESCIIEDPQMIQYEIIEEKLNPGVNKIIIEPQSTQHFIENSTLGMDIENKVSSFPTSVIVRNKEAGPELISVPIFKNQVEVVNDDEEETIKPITGILWNKDDVSTISTEAIFNKLETEIQNETTEQMDISEPLWIPEKETVVEVIDHEVFEEVFIGAEKLEKVAPFAGNQNVNLTKCAAALFDTLNFDDMICLDFDNNDEFLVSKYPDNPNEQLGKIFSPVEHTAFDEQQVLIDPDRNTMWGSNNQITKDSQDNSEMFLPKNGINSHVICSQEDVNKNNTFNQIKQKIVQNSFGIIVAEPKLIPYGYEDHHCIEPPGEKIICRPKKQTMVSQKRVMISDIFDTKNEMKKKRIDLDNKEGSTVTNLPNFDPIINDNIVVNMNEKKGLLKFLGNIE